MKTVGLVVETILQFVALVWSLGAVLMLLLQSQMDVITVFTIHVILILVDVLMLRM